MELHDIRYFVASAKARNLTWASKQCDVTQSTMTRSLQRIEDELGGLLFIRNQNKLLDLTPIAELILPEMEKICSTLDNIHRIAKTSAHSGAQPSRMRMNISELTERVAEDSTLSKEEVRRLIESALKVIVDTAIAGGNISLANFGKFKITSRPAREGRNPATGEAIQIAATKKLSFIPAKPVRDALKA